MADRIKLNIIEVKEKRAVGQAEVVEFIAEDASGKKLKYGTWSKDFWPHIKVNTTLEADIETKVSEKLNPDTGEPYISRKVVQIYLDGKPVKGEQRPFVGGRRGYSSEERSSIERQCCLKAAVDFTKDWTGLGVIGLLEVADVFSDWVATGNLPKSTSTVKSGQGTVQAPKAVAEQVKASDGPFPVEEMLSRICEKMKFGSLTTARRWLIEKIETSGEEIDADPEGAWILLKAKMGWE